jgi:hypothetical protein
MHVPRRTGSRDRPSIRAGAPVLVRDRAIAISFVTSSSLMVNSTTSRGAAVMAGLAQRIH